MKTPKYTIGQKVWKLENGKAKEFNIYGIIQTEDVGLFLRNFYYQLNILSEVQYEMEVRDLKTIVYEDELFETKEDLKNSI